MRTADAIVRTLKEEEQVEIVFGICGGYLFWLLHAFDKAGVRTIPSRHEGAAAFMAAAYAQASGRLGVVFGQGPGATNLMTGVASAYCESTPLLAIASQAPQANYAGDAHQEATGSNMGIDQADAFRPLVREVFRCPSSTSALRTLRRALAIAHGERGPVMIEWPANILGEEGTFEPVPSHVTRAEPRRVDVEGVAELAALIAKAARPVLVIGSRATHRGLASDLRALVEQASLPFGVTDFAKGIIPEDHPLCLGVLGPSGHESLHTYLESADLVITLGARLDSKSTMNYTTGMFPNLVQIDEIAAEIGRSLPLKLGILGDIPATTRALADALRSHTVERPAATWAAEARKKHRTYNDPLALEPANEMTSPSVIHALRECMPRETLVVGDSGMNLSFLKRFFPVFAPDGFYCFYGFAAMGSGLPVAMGVQIARPDDVVMLVIGDGGLLVHIGELQVMAEYNLPVVIVCLNNASYWQVEAYMQFATGSKYGCPIQEIDAAAIARSFGCEGYTVRSLAELATATKKAVAKRRPTVIDVKVTGDKLEDVMLARSVAMVSKNYGRKQ
jgi:acetolactate synthase I/II/III large subunit